MILTKILLFWESKSTLLVLEKNMIAHRPRNQLTANIYALTLGCIIFLIISANMQLTEITNANIIAGADIIATGSMRDDGLGSVTPADVDTILERYADDISDFSLVTHRQSKYIDTSYAKSMITDQYRTLSL